MAFEPYRQQPQFNQPGNALRSSPNMMHPNNNPGGMLPAPVHARGVEAWSDFRHQQFLSDGTNQVWLWQSVLFDLRPGMSDAYGFIPAAQPINHEGALGLNIYLGLIFGTRGTSPLAIQTNLQVEYWEDGHNTSAESLGLTRLTQDIDITDTILAGGTRTTAPVGASPIAFTPCMLGLRFWQVSVRVTIEGVVAITEPYYLSACIH